MSFPLRCPYTLPPQSSQQPRYPIIINILDLERDEGDIRGFVGFDLGF
jgi:hypothetical protein